MPILIRNAQVYAPESRGVNNVLIEGGRIMSVSSGAAGLEGELLETIDAQGRWLLPGFVDVLTHPCGGGGEGGFGNRTPELEADEFIHAGVTTPVGALGTDSITRSLEVLFGKTMELRAKGLSALMYNGSYRMPPLTLTGDVARDMLLVEPVIGVGEVAISDHRSSQPTTQELRRLAADVHLGGTLSGKQGVVFLHLGDGGAGLEPIESALAGTELPRRLFYPTHSNRNRLLLEQAAQHASRGGYADITVSTTEELIAAGDIPALDALSLALEAGAPAERITLSSDAGGSLPLYRDGELAGLQSASPGAMFDTLTAAIGRADTVETVIAAMTRNPARALGLARKGCIAPGFDADLMLLDASSGSLDFVMCQGQWLLKS
ncbi:MAG: beta-aspartyl-peptidase [Lysobacterales bacterium]|jgi:beta-aspartyl-dipeptidase (metallo-type)